MQIPPILENELVLMRPLKSEDFDALYDAAKDPLTWEQHKAPNRYQKEIFTNYFNDNLASQQTMVVIEKSTQKIIGSSRFNELSEANAIEIGWTFLDRNYWGGKYNQSFKELMITYAFNYFDAVVFYVAGNNERSRAAVRKLGGKQIFDAHHPLFKDAPSYTSFVIWKAEWDG